MRALSRSPEEAVYLRPSYRRDQGDTQDAPYDALCIIPGDRTTPNNGSGIVQSNVNSEVNDDIYYNTAEMLQTRPDPE